MSSIQFYPSSAYLSAQMQQEVAAIFVDNFTAAPRYENWDNESALAYLQSLWSKGAATWVSYKKDNLGNREEEGMITGFAIGIIINKHTQSHEPQLLNHYAGAFYLEEIAVCTEAQGQGIGKQLMQASLSDTQNSYPSYVTRVRSDAPAMVYLLESLGFKQVDSYLATKGGVISQRLIYRYENN